MQKQTTQLTSKQWVDQMLREHYEKARQAKAEGRLVCWSTSIAPQELLTTMDIVTMYPENHAAAIGAGGLFLRPVLLRPGEPGLFENPAQRGGEHAHAGLPPVHHQHLPHGDQVV